jgi:hypothetical protein
MSLREVSGAALNATEFLGVLPKELFARRRIVVPPQTAEDGPMSLPHSNVHLSPEEKLEIICELDPANSWESLDDWRYCTVCKKLFSGRHIEVIGGARPSGPLRLHCPTAECDSTPAHWHSAPMRAHSRENAVVYSFPPDGDGHGNGAPGGFYRDNGR